MVANQGPGQFDRRIGRPTNGTQLQQQALRKRPGADPDRLEAVQQAERGGDLVGLDLEFLGQHCRDVLERELQVAVIVEFVDQQRDQRPVALRAACGGQLAEQVFAQRRP